MSTPGITAHGGMLINRIAAPQEIAAYTERAQALPQLTIHNRYASDCEMIANGGFSPLTGFLTRTEAESVINTMRLPNGLIWALPIMLPVPANTVDALQPGTEVALNDPQGILIAILKIKEKFTLNLESYCQKVYKTTETAHPGVKSVQEGGNHFLGGELVQLVNRPQRETIDSRYFLDPSNMRAEFQQRGWKTIVAFQTRNPIHRAHEYLIKCALESLDGALIHPLVGETKSDDIPADVRMKCYETLIENYFNPDKVMLSALPAAMRYAGPREAIHHLIIRQNYGCTHMIIGRDHAGVAGYYGSYEAQELAALVGEQLGIIPLSFEHAFYSKKCESLITTKTGPNLPDDAISLSGTKVREMLRQGQRPPKEFSRPEVADILIEWALKEAQEEEAQVGDK